MDLAEKISDYASKVFYNGYEEYDINDITVILCLDTSKNKWMVKLTNPENYNEAVAFAETPERALRGLLDIIRD